MLARAPAGTPGLAADAFGADGFFGAADGEELLGGELGGSWEEEEGQLEAAAAKEGFAAGQEDLSLEELMSDEGAASPQAAAGTLALPEVCTPFVGRLL